MCFANKKQTLLSAKLKVKLTNLICETTQEKTKVVLKSGLIMLCWENLALKYTENAFFRSDLGEGFLYFSTPE